MEIHEALTRCLRVLEAEPAQLVALASRLAAQAGKREESSIRMDSAPGYGSSPARSNQAVLRSSQAVLVETLSQLSNGSS